MKRLERQQTLGRRRKFMRRLKVAVLLVLTLSLTSPTFAADPYEIDRSHSSIAFSVRHMMVSNVKGNFKDFSGVILYDDKDITKSSVNVAIKTASVDTDSENRDNDLRSPNFFDAAKYPEITFVSKQVQKAGDGYVCSGTLTMHGVSKEISIPFKILGTVKDQRGNSRMGIEATLTINRTDYGIVYSRALEGGGLVVGNEVKIELNLETIFRKPASQ
jgi:polyisoprenoid-binding protein YceI